MRRYWFTPKQFWKYFAAYYPSSPEGYLVTIALFFILLYAFFTIDKNSHSTSDTLIGVTPYALVILFIYDLLCFRTGEYPSWWKNKK